jgi:hypothetical protein
MGVSAAQSGTWSVGANSATGSAAPANGFYMALLSSSGNLQGAAAVANLNDGGASTNLLAAGGMLYNSSTFDRTRSIINAINSTGTGIQAVGLIAQLDDTSPTTITENQFGNARLSADRSLLVTNRATTPTQTSVAAITNDSSAVLYLKLGTTASTTSYTMTVAGSAAAPFSSYEVPFGYVGAIDGIWASATGNARITELA